MLITPIECTNARIFPADDDKKDLEFIRAQDKGRGQGRLVVANLISPYSSSWGKLQAIVVASGWHFSIKRLGSAEKRILQHPISYQDVLDSDVVCWRDWKQPFSTSESVFICEAFFFGHILTLWLWMWSHAKHTQFLLRFDLEVGVRVLHLLLWACLFRIFTILSKPKFGPNPIFIQISNQSFKSLHFFFLLAFPCGPSNSLSA